MIRKLAACTTGALLALCFCFAAGAAEPIRIGDINSYSGMAAFTVPYRNGAHLAIEEINAAGGVLGRPLELVRATTTASPTTRCARGTAGVQREGRRAHRHVLLAHRPRGVRLRQAEQGASPSRPRPLTDALSWQRGNHYTFRVRSSTYMQAAMLVEQAAKLPAKRWADHRAELRVRAFGRPNVQGALEAQPDVEFVAEQYPTLGKIDAGAALQALDAAKPEAHLQRHVRRRTSCARARRQRRAASSRAASVVSVMTGEPDFLDPLKDEAPDGWIVTGYAWDQINTPEHKAFLDAYRRSSTTIRAPVGRRLHTMKAIAAAIRRRARPTPRR